MNERMIGVRVSITRHISDEQPEFVECEFTDAHGRRWVFVEKTPVIGSDYLDARSPYPQPGVIGCQITGRQRDTAGREIILVDTEKPSGIESVEGCTEFAVFPDALVQWLWGSSVKEPWDGRD